MNDRPIVHGMWIGQRLSAMELLTINSFIRNGYTFYLWAYDGIENPPPGTEIRDAASIVPREQVFSYQHPNKFGHGKGSYAGFSDIFRYKLLYEFGGIWTDMDMTCLADLPSRPAYQFRHHEKTGVVGNYLQCPAGSDLMKWCFETAIGSMHAASTDWMLPIEILNRGIVKFELGEFILKATNNDSFPLVSHFLKPGNALPADWILMHWMNEEFRRLNIPKDACLEGSALHQLCARFEVPISILSGYQAASYSWKISRMNYLGVNLMARWRWYLSKAVRRS